MNKIHYIDDNNRYIINEVRKWSLIHHARCHQEMALRIDIAMYKISKKTIKSVDKRGILIYYLLNGYIDLASWLIEGIDDDEMREISVIDDPHLIKKDKKNRYGTFIFEDSFRHEKYTYGCFYRHEGERKLSLDVKINIGKWMVDNLYGHEESLAFYFIDLKSTEGIEYLLKKGYVINENITSYLRKTYCIKKLRLFSPYIDPMIGFEIKENLYLSNHTKDIPALLWFLDNMKEIKFSVFIDYLTRIEEIMRIDRKVWHCGKYIEISLYSYINTYLSLETRSLLFDEIRRINENDDEFFGWLLLGKTWKETNIDVIIDKYSLYQLLYDPIVDGLIGEKKIYEMSLKRDCLFLFVWHLEWKEKIGFTKDILLETIGSMLVRLMINNRKSCLKYLLEDKYVIKIMLLTINERRKKLNAHAEMLSENEITYDMMMITLDLFIS